MLTVRLKEPLCIVVNLEFLQHVLYFVFKYVHRFSQHCIYLYSLYGFSMLNCTF